MVRKVQTLQNYCDLCDVVSVRFFFCDYFAERCSDQVKHGTFVVLLQRQVRNYSIDFFTL